MVMFFKKFAWALFVVLAALVIGNVLVNTVLGMLI